MTRIFQLAIGLGLGLGGFASGGGYQGAAGSAGTIPPDTGGGAPWRSFGGEALRVGGMILRVTSKALVVELSA